LNKKGFVVSKFSYPNGNSLSVNSDNIDSVKNNIIGQQQEDKSSWA
jgi:hypothetical protein